MKRNLQIGAAVLAVLALMAFAERRVLVQERARHRELQAELAAAATPSNKTPASEAPTSEAQAARRDLPRLRNEVRQFRESVTELPRLRDERNRLAQELAEAAAKPKVAEPTPEAGFLMNNAWSFAGFGAPEATLQSFFSAMRDSNVVKVVACLTPEFGAGERTDARIRQTQSEFMKAAEGFRRVAGYRIAATENVAEDHVILKVQAAANGITADIHVRRIDGAWKIDMGR